MLHWVCQYSLIMEAIRRTGAAQKEVRSTGRTKMTEKTDWPTA